MVHVNDIIAYNKIVMMKFHYISDQRCRKHGINFKIIDGFQAIGTKLEAGEITADKIIMKSWLLNQKMEAKARMLLGDEISIQDTSPEDSDVAAVQHLALQYNKRSLEKYLKTGEKPEVRQVVMTKDEFVARFRKSKTEFGENCDLWASICGATLCKKHSLLRSSFSTPYFINFHHTFSI